MGYRLPKRIKRKPVIDSKTRTWAERLHDIHMSTGYSYDEIRKKSGIERHAFDNLWYGRTRFPALSTIRKIRRLEEEFESQLAQYRLLPGYYARADFVRRRKVPSLFGGYKEYEYFDVKVKDAPKQSLTVLRARVRAKWGITRQKERGLPTGPASPLHREEMELPSTVRHPPLTKQTGTRDGRIHPLNPQGIARGVRSSPDRSGGEEGDHREEKPRQSTFVPQRKGRHR